MSKKGQDEGRSEPTHDRADRGSDRSTYEKHDPVGHQQLSHRPSNDTSGPAARADHGIDTSAGDGARTLLCDDQLPHIGIERSDRTLD